MKIHQANTYTYENGHFGKLLEQGQGVPGECFKNVKKFCEDYRLAGRDVSVSLVVGMKAWDTAEATMCYHYLVKDNQTGEFADPQYWRYTFIELHNRSLEEYNQECDKFQEENGYHPAEEFFSWYCLNGYGKAIEHSLKLIKSLSDFRVKLADKEIEAYRRGCYDGCKPLYGKQVIEKLRID